MNEFHYLFVCSHFKSERKKNNPLQYDRKARQICKKKFRNL